MNKYIRFEIIVVSFCAFSFLIFSPKAHSQNDLSERISRSLYSNLPSSEVYITDEAESELDAIVQKAVNQLTKDNANEDRIREAENNLTDFAKALKRRGTKLGNGRISITKSVIDGFCDWFGPAYPICP